jgi:putative transposase
VHVKRGACAASPSLRRWGDLPEAASTWRGRDYKRVERLYRLEKLQVQRRRRKKRDLMERYPRGRPSRLNEVWFMDFVFDRTVSGRTLNCLTVVDDATHGPVAVMPDHGID